VANWFGWSWLNPLNWPGLAAATTYAAADAELGGVLPGYFDEETARLVRESTHAQIDQFWEPVDRRVFHGWGPGGAPPQGVAAVTAIGLAVAAVAALALFGRR
jgi:hypothetical protein